MRELLVSYVALARDRARREYEDAVKIWAAQAHLYRKPPKPPRLPAILKDDYVDT